MFKKIWLSVALAGALASLQPDCALAKSHFKTIRLMRSATAVWGLNDSGSVTGDIETPLPVPGFLRTSDGTVTTFTVSGSPATAPTSINNEGVIAGDYEGSQYGWQPFVRNADGTITTYAVPGDTSTTGINDSGTVVGQYAVDNGSTGYGFVLTADGSLTTVQVDGSWYTTITGINAAGTVVGWYYASNEAQAFFMTSDGTITTFGAGGDTYAAGINDNGQIAGTCYAGGFVRNVDGTITTVGCPTGSAGCEATGINSSGQVAGVAVLSQSPPEYVGFSWSPDGTTQVFGPKGYYSPYFYTAKINVNGRVAGSYLTSNQHSRGFLWKP